MQYHLGPVSRTLDKGPLKGVINVLRTQLLPQMQVGSQVVGDKYPKSFFFILQISSRDSPLAKSNLKPKCKGSWVINSAEGHLQSIKQGWRKAPRRFIRANGE